MPLLGCTGDLQVGTRHFERQVFLIPLILKPVTPFPIVICVLNVDVVVLMRVFRAFNLNSQPNHYSLESYFSRSNAALHRRYLSIHNEENPEFHSAALTKLSHQKLAILTCHVSLTLLYQVQVSESVVI